MSQSQDAARSHAQSVHGEAKAEAVEESCESWMARTKDACAATGISTFMETALQRAERNAFRAGWHARRFEVESSWRRAALLEGALRQLLGNRAPGTLSCEQAVARARSVLSESP